MKHLNECPALTPRPKSMSAFFDYKPPKCTCLAMFLASGSVKVYGVAHQHEDTGAQGVVDTWQAEQGFFENNPRLEKLGKVFIVLENEDE